MALQPIHITSGDGDRQTPPARPTSPAERFVVPGQPRAELHRPLHSPGRIPVAAPTEEVAENEPLALIDDIDKRVRESKEYQALKPFLTAVGLADEEETAGTQASGEENISVTTVETESVTVVSWRMSITRVSITMSGPPEQQPVERSDPLALDLDGDGIETTGFDRGVRFDIDGDGTLDRTSFIAGDDAFVALDRNGNGRIDDGRELFGDQRGDANGYEALARYDDNRDGRIDVNDRIYHQLRLLNIAGDGTQRLRSLSGAGITTIGLNYQNSDQAINAYDRIAQASTFERSDGSSGESADLLLGFSPDS